MNWQIKYALDNFKKNKKIISTSHIQGDCIKIRAQDMSDIIAIISSNYEMKLDTVKLYQETYPNIDFICGYRRDCIWFGEAIHYLEERKIGWGNFRTLNNAICNDNVNLATHIDFHFAYRVINQSRSIIGIDRELDRVFTVFLHHSQKLRIGMLQEYEPTVDAIRSFWEKFGPVDIIWNINPNSKPTLNAIEAGQELGCKVVKWQELKEIINSL